MEFTQFKSIIDLVKNFDTEQKCIDYLTQLRWVDGIVSPFDETSVIYVCKGNKYKCKNTGKYFNVRTGTMFDDTKMPLQKWFMGIYIVASHKKGISSHQLARDLGITQKSAWFMLHRIRYTLGIGDNNEQLLENTVEIDETFVGGATKNKHANKVNKNIHGATIREKSVVFGMIERGGNVVAYASGDRHKETLMPLIHKTVKKNSCIITDEYNAYRDLKINYNHFKINHASKEYVNGAIHTNSIENFWSLFKRGIIGIYHFISPKHMQQYVDEFTYRFNTRTLTDSHRFALVLTNSNNKIKYSQLISQ